MVILVNKGGEKTKPIQSQSRAFGRTSEVRQQWTTGRMDDERLSTRQSSLVLSSFGPASSVGREAKNCSEYLPIKQIRAIFSKKKVASFGRFGYNTEYQRFSFRRPIRMSYSRIVGSLEVCDYGRNVLFLRGSRRKTQ